MVDDKVGTKPYLGIVIDYDKEKKLDKFSLDTLRDRNTCSRSFRKGCSICSNI